VGEFFRFSAKTSSTNPTQGTDLRAFQAIWLKQTGLIKIERLTKMNIPVI
jgi:hypothetical protein